MVAHIVWKFKIVVCAVKHDGSMGAVRGVGGSVGDGGALVLRVVIKVVAVPMCHHGIGRSHLCCHFRTGLTEVVRLVERTDAVAKLLILATGIVDERRTLYLTSDALPDTCRRVVAIDHVAIDVGIGVGSPRQFYTAALRRRRQSCRNTGGCLINSMVGRNELPQLAVVAVVFPFLYVRTIGTAGSCHFKVHTGEQVRDGIISVGNMRQMPILPVVRVGSIIITPSRCISPWVHIPCLRIKVEIHGRVVGIADIDVAEVGVRSRTRQDIPGLVVQAAVCPLIHTLTNSCITIRQRQHFAR